MEWLSDGSCWTQLEWCGPDGWTGRTGPEDLELRLWATARAARPMQLVTDLSRFESAYVFWTDDISVCTFVELFVLSILKY